LFLTDHIIHPTKMAKPTSQPKHRISVPAKSALKTGPPAKKAPVPVKGKGKAVAKPKPAAGPAKRKQPEKEEEISDIEDGNVEEGLSDISGSDGEDEFDVNAMEVDAEGSASGRSEDDDEEEVSTDEEIEGMKTGKRKSKKNTSKFACAAESNGTWVSSRYNFRSILIEKRKATTTNDVFAATLTSLLDEPPVKKTKLSTETGDAEPSTKKPKSSINPILSLSAASALPPSTKQIKLERQAKRQLKQEKMDRKDKARIKDVLEGWAPRPVLVVKPAKEGEERKADKKEGKKDAFGKVKPVVQEGVEILAPGGQEWERGLRKVAQRGGQFTHTHTSPPCHRS
jgi:hypothetical protein